MSVLSKSLAFLINFAAFLAAFALVCAGIGAVLPEPKVPVVTTKLDWMAERGDEYDTLFIGSSRTHRQMMPEIFDAEMAAAGHPVRSFNAGVEGMRPPEDTYLLEKILARRTKPIRLVLVECNSIRLFPREGDRDTLRAVYWHDNVRMRVLLRAALIGDGKKGIGGGLGDFFTHARYWLWRNSNLGWGHDLLAEWIGVAPAKMLSTSALGERNDGFAPPIHEGLANEDERGSYEKELTVRSAELERGKFGSSVSVDELRAKQRLIERAGGRMVLVIPPFIREKFLRLKPEDGLPPVLNFADPEKYPELFSAEHRTDTGHTNLEGAKIYSRLVVRELLSLMGKPEGR